MSKLLATLGLPYGTILSGDQLATWEQVDCIETFPFQKDQWFILTGTDTYSYEDLLYLPVKLHINTTIQGLLVCLIHMQNIYSEYHLTRGTTSHWRRCWNVLRSIDCIPNCSQRLSASQSAIMSFESSSKTASLGKTLSEDGVPSFRMQCIY